MARALASLLCVFTLAGTAVLGATAGTTTSAAGTHSTATVITLRGRTSANGVGTWQRRLRLKLLKLRLNRFELCAMVNQTRFSPSCDANVYP